MPCCLFLVLLCRVGEASVPGPSTLVLTEWSLGTCNPCGLCHEICCVTKSAFGRCVRPICQQLDFVSFGSP